MSALRYAVDEAAVSLWRRRRANVLSVVTITVALFVLGVFLLVHANVQQWLDDWTQVAEVSVYLADDITTDQKLAVEQLLTGSRAVATRAYVSRDEALTRFARMFPELAASAKSVDAQPLPASFEVRLEAAARSDEAVDGLAAQLKRLPGVTDVRYDRRWIARISALAAAGRLAGLVLAAILVIAAAMTVASVVRLAMHARRDEIDIMQLVGAPLAYIRGPFVVEGVLQGGLGAIVAVAALAAAFVAVRGKLGAMAAGAGFFAGQGLTFLPWPWTMGLLVGGMAVGCLGGIIAARGVR